MSLAKKTKQKTFIQEKNSMMASWDDSDNSNLEIWEEEAYLCLMTNLDIEEVNVSNFCQTCKTMEIKLIIF